MLLWCPRNSCKVSAALETCEGTIGIPPKDHDAIFSLFNLINVIWEETNKTVVGTLSEPNNSIVRIYDEEYRTIVTLNAYSFSLDDFDNIGATFHTLKSTLKYFFRFIDYFTKNDHSNNTDEHFNLNQFHIFLFKKLLSDDKEQFL